MVFRCILSDWGNLKNHKQLCILHINQNWNFTKLMRKERTKGNYSKERHCIFDTFFVHFWNQTPITGSGNQTMALVAWVTFKSSKHKNHLVLLPEFSVLSILSWRRLVFQGIVLQPLENSKSHSFQEKYYHYWLKIRSVLAYFNQ